MATLILICIAILVQLDMILAESAQTVCSEGDIQLLGSKTKLEGVVHFCSNNVWRTICHSNNNRWDNQIATTVCKQLGYLDRGATASSRCLGFTPDNYIKIANCTGLEDLLGDCNLMEQEGCTREGCIDGNTRRHAYLKCSAANCTDGEIRLVNGTTNREGRVEVCLDGRWGTVCNLNEAENIARATCTAVGLPIEGVTITDRFGQGTAPIYSCAMVNETTFDCNRTNDNCTHSNDLGVVCQTYQELIDQIINQTINETRQECTMPTCPPATTPTCPPVTMTSLKNTNCSELDRRLGGNTTALGAAIGVLVALLVGIVIGWICTCVFLRRKPSLVEREYTLEIIDKNEDSHSMELNNPLYEGAPETRIMDNTLYAEASLDEYVKVVSLPRLRDNPIYQGADMMENPIYVGSTDSKINNYSSSGPAHQLMGYNKGDDPTYDAINEASLSENADMASSNQPDTFIETKADSTIKRRALADTKEGVEPTYASIDMPGTEQVTPSVDITAKQIKGVDREMTPQMTEMPSKDIDKQLESFL